MTDKQINTCEFFDICEAACGGTLEDTEMCNCYELYKQLKLKEQEYERLKYNNNYEVAVLQTTIDNLKEELEQERTLKEMYFTYYKAKHSDIKGEFFRLKTENEKLKQTLTEIKEIAEYCYDPVDKENDGFWSILQKISEVEQ